MKSLIPLSTLLVIAAAAPFEILSSRSLTEREDAYLAERYRQGRSWQEKNSNNPTCPANGNLPATGYLSPTLMVPISASSPNIAFGSTQNPIITPNDFCTIFNLVIPGSAVGKKCTLEFLFPSPKQTKSPADYNGPGHFTFTGYAFDSGATLKTTYNNQPPPGPSPPQPPAVLSPGNAYIINVGDCGIQRGQKSMTVSGKLCSTDTTFVFRQSSDVCPLGFFVVIS
ncbi:ubiquitin 3 binding protein But2 C-terminal domain-containing protein [Tricladium varicosporioides]|nr:ubiquitin 3 binding protein But2 C-terminal domain-containing protein [Hymenoscyphus varicosporioides]